MRISETNQKKIFLTLALVLHMGAAYAQLTPEQYLEKAASHYPAVAQYALIDRSEEFNISNAAICDLKIRLSLQSLAIIDNKLLA